jgi:hypothetical protein
MSKFIAKQEYTLNKLLRKGIHSDFGKAYQFSKLKSIYDFQHNVPIGDYQSHKQFWGDFEDSYQSTWPGKIVLLGKTSGTDKNGSKHIPIMKEFMNSNRNSFIKYMNVLRKNGLINLNDILFKKAFFIGSQSDNDKTAGLLVDNMSFYALNNAPSYIKNRIVPNFSNSNNLNLNQVLIYISEHAKKWDIYGISGFPNWIMQVSEKLKKVHGQDLKSIWPNRKFYIYSGMDITPYLAGLRSSLGNIPFLETFVATEGFYGYQFPDEPGMRFNFNSGIFFELLATTPDESLVNNPIPGTKYQLVVSTNTGLWRYKTGDCISFINENNFKFSGRISDTLNLMGELITSEQIQLIIQQLSTEINSEIKFITILPYKINNWCQHFWFICTNKGIEISHSKLDEIVSNNNITYNDYRQNNSGMLCAQIIPLNESVFLQFLANKNKLNAQSKIPLVLPVNEPYFSDLINKSNAN